MTRPRSIRRAFAMPMVILLMVVTGLAISVTVQRHAAEQRLVTRQIRAYEQHHTGRGLQTAIGAWLRQQTGRDMGEVLGAGDGHAMDIILTDGSVVSISMVDAQGALLSDLTTLNDGQIEEMSRALRILSSRVEPSRFQRLTRPVGPVGVSVQTAPPEVLRAVCLVASDRHGSRLANEFARLQNEGDPITRQSIVEVATRTGLGSEERATLLRLLVTDVTLWGVVVEVRGGRGLSQGRLLTRYGGLTTVRANSGRTGRDVAQLGSFLTWKELEIDGRGVEPADLY